VLPRDEIKVNLAEINDNLLGVHVSGNTALKPKVHSIQEPG
jgi:hypothetical protein